MLVRVEVCLCTPLDGVLIETGPTGNGIGSNAVSGDWRASLYLEDESACFYVSFYPIAWVVIILSRWHPIPDQSGSLSMSIWVLSVCGIAFVY